jgi:TM2 domain-containing membrane protein YozV
MEVSHDSDYATSAQLMENERVGGKIVQLNPERLSSIDYKSQALFVLVFGGLGVGDFYAGNYLQGLAKLTLSLFIGRFAKGVSVPSVPIIIGLLSLINLSQGKYADAKGKLIRQVVQLKKEEISSCDQKIALILCSFLGWLGAHQFYAGKPLKGVLMLCSLGGLGIWHIMNVYQLATCSFKDGQGKTICPNYIKNSAT